MEILVLEASWLEDLSTEEALKLSIRYQVRIAARDKSLIVLEADRSGLRHALQNRGVRVLLHATDYARMVQALLPAFDTFLSRLSEDQWIEADDG